LIARTASPPSGKAKLILQVQDAEERRYPAGRLKSSKVSGFEIARDMIEIFFSHYKTSDFDEAIDILSCGTWASLEQRHG
jgi:hypothetical protein